MGKEVYVVPDCEIDPEDEEERKRLTDGVDMVISMGGDHTFLKSSALIQNQDIPIMGISTTSDYTMGALNIIGIDPFHQRTDVNKILEQIENPDAISFEKRSRIHFERMPHKNH